MELVNNFSVGAPIETVWSVLTDLERVAGCMPGAQLTEVEGETYRGTVKVKVGPITQAFQGQAHFVERDDVAHQAVLRAEGTERRGQGTAAATIRTSLEADGGHTKVAVVTDLMITGKAAQFGRSLLADVSERLLQAFVTRLEADILATPAKDEAAPVAPDAAPDVVVVTAPVIADTPAVPTRRVITSAPVEPLDLVSVSFAAMLRRTLPVLAVLAAVCAIVAVFLDSWQDARWPVTAALVLYAITTTLSSRATPATTR